MTARSTWRGRRRNLFFMTLALRPFRQGAFGSRDLSAALSDPPDAAERYAAQRHQVGNARQHAVGEVRQRLFGSVEPEGLERNSRKHEDGGAADLVDAIDMVDVLAAALRDALAGLHEQFVALAKLGGAGRTDLGARSRLALGDTRGAHVALAHARQDFVPFVFGNIEGARHHAVATAHALVLVIGDGTERGLLQRADRTNGSAGRVLAVHAQTAHVGIALGHDRGVFVGRSGFLGGVVGVVREAVLGRAGALAELATD